MTNYCCCVSPCFGIEPRKFNGILVLQNTYFVEQVLIKYPTDYFFLRLSTIKHISAIYVIKRITSKLTGEQFYCGIHF